MTHDRDPVARSDAFDDMLRSSSEHISLVRIVKDHKLILRWLVVSIALDLVLSGFVTWFAFQAHSAASAAASTSTQFRIGCQASNDQRTTERRLWDYILSFPPPDGETRKARALRLSETRRLKAYVQRNLGDRNCASSALRKNSGPIPPFAPVPAPRSSSSVSPAAVLVVPEETTTVTSVATAPASPPGSPSASSSPSPSHSPSPRLCLTPHLCVPPR